jgi:hypothetical protein
MANGITVFPAVNRFAGLQQGLERFAQGVVSGQTQGRQNLDIQSFLQSLQAGTPFAPRTPAGGQLAAQFALAQAARTPQGFTLGPGQQRFGPTGQPVAQVPAAPPTRPQLQARRILELQAKERAGVITEPEKASLKTLLEGAAQVQVFTGDVAKTTRAKLEQDIIGLNDTIATLEDIGVNFEPAFQTFAGKVRAGGEAFLERVFRVPPAKTEAFLKSIGITKESDPTFLERLTTFETTAYERLNQAIKEITGVAVRPEERPRIAKQTVDPAEDSPTQFKAKRKEALRIANQMKKRRLVVLVRGQLPTRENLRRIDLLKVDKIFEREIGTFISQPKAINQNKIDAAGKEFGF